MFALMLLGLLACEEEGEEGAGTTSEPTTPAGTDPTAAPDCADPDVNPFAGTCVETFLAGCFDPVGECTYESSGLEVSLSWDNGATVVTEAGMTSTTTLTASDGTECAVGTTEVNAGGCFSKTSYRRFDGEIQVWCIQADGSFEVTCDDGTTIAVEADQSEDAQSCNYGGEPCQPA
jgi:hypothetical protein